MSGFLFVPAISISAIDLVLQITFPPGGNIFLFHLHVGSYYSKDSGNSLLSMVSFFSLNYPEELNGCL